MRSLSEVLNGPWPHQHLTTKYGYMKKLLRFEFLAASFFVFANLLFFCLFSGYLLRIYIKSQPATAYIREVEYNDYYQKIIYKAEFYYNKDSFLVYNVASMRSEHVVGNQVGVIFEQGNPDHALLVDDRIWPYAVFHLIITMLLLYGYYKLAIYYLKGAR